MTDEQMFQVLSQCDVKTRTNQNDPSVCKGRVTCGQANCQRLLQQQTPASIVWAEECGVCKSERTSKAFVLHGKPGGASFAGADAILPTNAVKYHVNKLRAQEWVNSTKKECDTQLARTAFRRRHCEKNQT